MHTQMPKRARSPKPRTVPKTTSATPARAATELAPKSAARREHGRAAKGSADIRDSPFAESMRTEADADLRHRLISEAAYALFAERGYKDGYDVDDWLEAEARVDSTLRAGRPTQEEPEEV